MGHGLALRPAGRAPAGCRAPSPSARKPFLIVNHAFRPVPGGSRWRRTESKKKPRALSRRGSGSHEGPTSCQNPFPGARPVQRTLISQHPMAPDMPGQERGDAHPDGEFPGRKIPSGTQCRKCHSAFPDGSGYPSNRLSSEKFAAKFAVRPKIRPGTRLTGRNPLLNLPNAGATSSYIY
jgi:hypothetical protein